ncbi:hypothetical protein CCACVL1_04142 [Corchorus capsularis]|uniref:Uncharacterized protein n=1 Tax=Corchorus capsularis TaxID=210143 RepID=A0A1R3JVC0_COCAP|nr:hypothetical protein CCACVL1_04142 [Corchorus capsularis]
MNLKPGEIWLSTCRTGELA